MRWFTSTRFTFVVALLLALALAACGRNETTPTEPTAAEMEATPEAAIEAIATSDETGVVTDTAEAGAGAVAETEATTDTTDAATADAGAAAETEAMTETEAAPDTGATGETEAMTETEATTDTVAADAGAAAAPLSATAVLVNAAGEQVGVASFAETETGAVQITADFVGLEAAAGEHGIHFHMVGACTPDFEAAGEHYNPAGRQHGLDNPEGPHAGDLPNLVVNEDGSATYSAETTLVTLSEGEATLFDADGSAFMVHANMDDQVTDPDGGSGDRIACGVVEQNVTQ